MYQSVFLVRPFEMWILSIWDSFKNENRQTTSNVEHFSFNCVLSDLFHGSIPKMECSSEAEVTQLQETGIRVYEKSALLLSVFTYSLNKDFGL